MYYLNKFCCICLDNKKKLKHLYKYKNTYSKLKLFMLSEFLNDSSIRKQALVCKKCRNYINEIHTFREKCIKNINLFENHINQLQLYNEPASELTICLSNSTENTGKDKLNNVYIKSEVKDDINCGESIENIEHHEFESVKLENTQINHFDESEQDNEFETFEDSDTILDTNITEGNSSNEDLTHVDINNIHYSEFITPEFLENTLKNEINSELIISDFDETLENYTLDIAKHEMEQSFFDENMPDKKNSILNNFDKTDIINISSEDEDFVQFTINNDKPDFVTYCFNKLNENEDNIENNINKNYNRKCDTYKKLYKKCLYKYTKYYKIKKLKCKVCKKIFDSKLELNIHSLTHDNKTNNCSKQNNQTDKNINNICDKTNEITANDNLQKNNDGSIKTKNFKCDFCNSTFASLLLLNKHQHTKHHFKEYQCHICNKFFLTKFKLIMHSYTHTDIKVHKCSVCKKIFISKLKLDKHMKKHMFHCDKCKRSFSHECTLKIHYCVMDLQ